MAQPSMSLTLKRLESDDASRSLQDMDPLNDSSNDNNILGIDEPLKLKSKKRIAKVDNERVLNKPQGLPYLIKNHHRLGRIVEQRDKKFAKQELRKLQSIHHSYKTPRQLKYDHEVETLGSILHFYQLWCHGMFPKANFKDCAYLVRNLGHRSSQLRLYRRELIEKEIFKLKVSKGIIDESSEVATRESESDGFTNTRSGNNDDSGDIFVSTGDNVYQNQMEFSGAQGQELPSHTLSEQATEQMERNDAAVSAVAAADDEYDDDWSFMNLELGIDAAPAPPSSSSSLPLSKSSNGLLNGSDKNNAETGTANREQYNNFDYENEIQNENENENENEDDIDLAMELMREHDNI